MLKNIFDLDKLQRIEVSHCVNHAYNKSAVLQVATTGNLI